MKTQDALKHFGGAAAIAKKLGITRQAVHQWNNVVPIQHAWTLRRASGYKLAVGLKDYRGDGPVQQR